MNYKSWLESIKDNPIELVKFSNDIYRFSNERKYKISLNENMDSESYIYIYNCLKNSERGLELYNFKTTPIITYWVRSNERIMRYSGALDY
tara:strand:+ start:957 stop:1229 length:273 start_codon:yes stop_codon:yes gene_type:complete